jgi:predicted RND superfamily exporter protein
MKPYERFAALMERKGKPFFILFVLLMLLALSGLIQLKINPDFMIFMPDHSPAKTTFDNMNKLFDSGDELIIALHCGTDTLDEQTGNTIVDLYDQLDTLQGIAYAVGPVVNNELSQQSFSEDLSNLVYKNGEWHAFLSVFADNTLDRSAVRHIESIVASTGMSYDLAGNAYMQKRLIDIIVRILFYMPFIAIFLIFSVFRFQMKSFKATLMSVLPAVVGAVWTLGLAGWLGKEVSILTALAPIFTIVIGSADGLHFVSHYLEARQQGRDKKSAVAGTLKLVGIPMIITTLTSMGGFLSLIVMDAHAIHDLALFASTGILFAGIATWFVLPLFLINKVEFKDKELPAHKHGNFLRKLWGVPALLITLLVIVAGMFGFSKVKTDFNQLSMFKKSTDVYQSVKAISEINGGGIPVQVFIRSSDDILDPDLKTAVNGITDSLRQFGKVISPFELTDALLDQPMFRFMRYMRSDRDILTDLMQQKDLPLDHMLSLDSNAARITVMPSDLSSTTLNDMRDIVDQVKIEHVSMKMTGMSYIMEDLNTVMIDNLKNTLFVSLLVMFVFLLITFRRIVPVLISLIPIMITMLFLYGFLGISGISLTLVTAMIFSISIGVGVDYAVHYSSVALELKDAEKAFDYASRPIITNALGLAIGMSALFTTPLMIHTQVSIMMWVTMVLSMFLSLSLLPTMMRWYLKRRSK